MLRTWLRWIAVLAVVVGAGVGYWLWREYQRRSMLPDGIVSGNGRIESIQVDVAAKYAGRISRIFAREGDLVKTGQVLAKMDTEEMEAELAKDKAKVAEAEEAENQVKAEIVQRESELKYQNQLYDRNRALLARSVISREEMEQTHSKRDVAVAALDATKAKLQTSRRSIEAAAAEVKRIQTQIVDSTLTSPVEGRVLYKLAEEREVLAAGGKVLTLINLGDIYMEIFLPSRQAARVEIGADARIVLDAAPQYAARAKVSFVSPEAQFTPKQVETQSERDKLMFRIKLQVPQELVLPYIEKIKTGVRGVGYIKLDEATPWPEKLERRFPMPEPTKPTNAEPATTEPKTPTEPKAEETPVPKT
ncbi:Multidrug export protein EmrA [Paludisphaera borealis]|uniref:Multidrug export protein EmrA n=1 Tax=Paludisphaera borealis TaxID=1387353 RepID=A0A1U7CLJ0_9BACT|nr:Multidrug export protein EmrA [Paludisphaera borealis]